MSQNWYWILLEWKCSCCLRHDGPCSPNIPTNAHYLPQNSTEDTNHTFIKLLNDHVNKLEQYDRLRWILVKKLFQNTSWKGSYPASPVTPQASEFGFPKRSSQWRRPTEPGAETSAASLTLKAPSKNPAQGGHTVTENFMTQFYGCNEQCCYFMIPIISPRT